MGERTVEVFFEGLDFGEGPRWHEGRLWVSDFYAHKVCSFAPTGEPRVEDIKWPSEYGAVFPARVYSLEQGGGRYSVTVVDYTDAERIHAALMAADHVTGIASAREALALAEALGQPALRFEAARLIAVGLAQQGKTGLSA